MNNNQDIIEKKVFYSFAKICSLGIKIESIKKNEPPVPDIECETIEGQRLLFELTEIIDADYANIQEKRKKILSEINKCYFGISKEKKVKFDKIYKGAFITFIFSYKMSTEVIKTKILEILNSVLNTRSIFENNIIKKINHSEYKIELDRPIFDVLIEKNVYSDRIINTIKKKFDKKYEAYCPVHLLCYIDDYPLLPKDAWEQSVADFCHSSSVIKRFEKIWIFNCHDMKIEFSFP